MLFCVIYAALCHIVLYILLYCIYYDVLGQSDNYECSTQTVQFDYRVIILQITVTITLLHVYCHIISNHIRLNQILQYFMIISHLNYIYAR